MYDLIFFGGIVWFQTFMFDLCTNQCFLHHFHDSVIVDIYFQDEDQIFNFFDLCTNQCFWHHFHDSVIIDIYFGIEDQKPNLQFFFDVVQANN